MALAFPMSEVSAAQKHQGNAARTSAPRTTQRAVVRQSRAPRVVYRAPNRQFTRKTVAPRLYSPKVNRVVVPRANRIVKTPVVKTPIVKAPVVRTPTRIVKPTLRPLPSNQLALNPGLRTNPGKLKPAHIVHNENHKAGKIGWQHHHRPFHFRRDGQRWKRLYYALPVAGLWYWYWYDVVAEDDPAALAYGLGDLPECYESEDDCAGVGAPTEGELVAPAIIEGRATEDLMRQCAERYRSFDARTGTFVAYGGDRQICPYLE